MSLSTVLSAAGTAAALLTSSSSSSSSTATLRDGGASLGGVPSAAQITASTPSSLLAVEGSRSVSRSLGGSNSVLAPKNRRTSSMGTFQLRTRNKGGPTDADLQAARLELTAGNLDMSGPLTEEAVASATSEFQRCSVLWKKFESLKEELKGDVTSAVRQTIAFAMGLDPYSKPIYTDVMKLASGPLIEPPEGDVNFRAGTVFVPATKKRPERVMRVSAGLRLTAAAHLVQKYRAEAAVALARLGDVGVVIKELKEAADERPVKGPIPSIMSLDTFKDGYAASGTLLPPITMPTDRVVAIFDGEEEVRGLANGPTLRTIFNVLQGVVCRGLSATKLGAKPKDINIDSGLMSADFLGAAIPESLLRSARLLSLVTALLNYEDVIKGLVADEYFVAAVRAALAGAISATLQPSA